MIVRGVEHCHKGGLVHCDLKLDNILVDYDEKSMKLKDIRISDFGLCKLLKKSEKAQGIMGTLPYMAPEMLKGKDYDGKIDSWALGVILHELMTC